MSDALDAAPGRIAAARAGGFGLSVARRAEAGEGWLAASDLARDDGPLDGLVDGIGRAAGTDLRQVGAEWLLELLAWHGAALTAAAMMSDFLKSDDFATEYEYRVVLAAGDDDYAYIDYRDSLVGVVLGERFPAWQRPAVVAACAMFDVRLGRMHWEHGRPHVPRVGS